VLPARDGTEHRSQHRELEPTARRLIVKYQAQCIVIVEADDEAQAWNRVNGEMGALRERGMYAAFVLDDAQVYVDEDTFKQMVRDFGLGFHPDTRGADYESLPDGYTVGLVDDMIASAFETVPDVYKITLDVFKELRG
jgi:hypothetical protein